MTTPAYLLAAESHDLMNGGSQDKSLLDSLGDIATKGVPSALVSAVNELSNIPAAIGNMFAGPDSYKITSNRQAIAEYDSDLVKYYDDHQMGIDTAGFLVSSFVPGMAGVKVYRAGSVALREAVGTGTMGKMTADSLGLLEPRRQALVKEAIASIGNQGSVFKMTDSAIARALTIGAVDQAIEGAVFTAAVNATMYRSPILDERSVSDLAWDVALGGVLGGAVGGVLKGVGTRWEVKKGLEGVEAEMQQYRQQIFPSPNMSTSERLITNLRALDSIPEPNPSSQFTQRAGREIDKIRNWLTNAITADVNELTKGDSVLRDSLLRDIAKNDLNQNMSNFLESQVITRANAQSAVEKRMTELLNKHKKTLTLTPEESQELGSYAVSYVNMHDPARAVLTDKPFLLNAADRIKAGETIQLARDGRAIQIGKEIIGQENNPYKPFNIFGLDHKKVEARYLWSEMLPKYVDDGSHVFHENDIPLLQKAVRDGLQKVKVIPEGAAVDEAIAFNSVDDLAAFVRGRQKVVAERLAKAEVMPQDVDTLVDKLKYYLGINFNVTSEQGASYYGFFHRILGKSGNLNVEGDVIALDKAIGLNRPIAEIVRTLKHEEGHAIFRSLLDARGISRQNLNVAYPLLASEVTALSKLARPALWKSTDPKQIAYRQDWQELFADAFGYLSRNPEKLKSYPEFEKFSGHLVRPIPQEILDAISRRAAKPSKQEIAKIVNAHEDAIYGVADKEASAELWNLRDHTRQVAVDNGLVAEGQDIWHTPTYAKIITKKSLAKDVDGNLLEGLAILEQKQQIYKQQAKQTADTFLGENALPSTAGMAGRPVGISAGPGALTAESENYGTWSSFFAFVGQRAKKLIGTEKAKVNETLTPTLAKLGNDMDAAIEWSVINEKLRGMPQGYYLSDDGAKLVYGKAPVPEAFETEEAFNKALLKHQTKLEEAKQQGVITEIEIKSPHVQKLTADHIRLNAGNRAAHSKIHSNNGYTDQYDPDVFYPIPRNPRDTPHFAFVVDDSITSRGHVKMIYAATADDLEKQRSAIIADNAFKDRGLRVLTKAESEEYYKSVGQFEFERTLSENYINNALARAGKSQSFIPLTDPKRIIENTLEWHQSRAAMKVRSLIEHHYQPEFNQFRAHGEAALQASKSKFGYVSPLAYAESTVDDPGLNLIKMALDISKADEYPLWTPLNKFLDGAVSKLFNEVGQIFSKATTPEHLTAVNEALKKANYGDVVVTDAIYQATNAKIPRGTLTSIVNKANALLATFALRADPINALNNAVGHAVLLGTELKSIERAILAGDEAAVGELGKLLKIKVPGTDDFVMSPSKLVADRIGKFHSDKAGRQWFKDKGFITSISDQYDQTLDHIAVALARGDESAIAKAMKTARELGDTAEKWTANKLVEEFNRYVAAGVMKDITDVAVKRGLMTEDLQLSYINTFVNRTQGNYVASQRPVIFQGPLGQAIGLFQTYQFNMLQQLFRHIGEGNAKNVATMAGLQMGVYGLNGLPAFNAINSHIIASAGGNTEHKNLYDAVFSGAGKDAGEWLLYGGLSNGLSLFHPDLKANIYTRGDINPRHITLVPTDPSQVPVVSATAKLFANVKESYQKISMGADVWSTFLRGVEQNGVSRPLAGLAQVLEGAGREDKKVISTNAQGNMLVAHDLWSLSSLMRISGAKPLDEATVNDQMFRIHSYRTADAQKRKVLGEGIKQSILGGAMPDESQINEFAASYVRAGGKQDEFAKWFAGLYKDASVSQAEQLRAKIGNPQSKTLQIMMGGE